MTQRDLAKDKETCEKDWRYSADTAMARYWISAYEDMKDKYSCTTIEHVMTIAKLKAARSRISELENEMSFWKNEALSKAK